MDIILDGVLTRDEVSAENVIQLLNNYLTTCLNKDMVIKSFRVNGMEVNEPMEAVSLNLQNNNVEKIEVITQSRAELIYDTAKTANEYLPKLTSAVSRISSDINLGKELDGGLWQQVIDGLEWMSGICSHLHNNNDLLPNNERSLEKELEKLNDVLSELIGALHSGDMVSVGDILEYELTEQLDNLNNILTANLILWDR